MKQRSWHPYPQFGPTHHQDDLQPLRGRLLAWLEEVLNLPEQEDFNIGPLTSSPLNRRMIDRLFLMKDKIRATRRRLNDSGEHYSETDYTVVRNQANLAQSIYLDQLQGDVVMATHADIAQLDQVYYPAIEQASGATFVKSIMELKDFMESKILAVFV
ncbi:MAG: hypothetical protein HC821_05985 [Lewinella sp.]|nr:hypothetical protein [Lewinella sp.]